MSEKALILADGEKIPTALSKRLRKERFTVVLDGAAEAVRKERWLPDLILGDFDTATAATLKFFAKKGVEVLKAPDQDFTDLEKALAWCVLRGFDSIWIAQATGLRLDHTLENLAVLKRYYSKEREIVLFTNRETVRFLRDESAVLTGAKGRGVSVIPFPKCTITSNGLAFEMKETLLALGERESVSNKTKTQRFSLDVHGDALVIEAFK